MKIAFVLDDTLDKTDGVQQYVLRLGEWLSGQGHDVHYLAGQTVRTDIAGVHSMSRNINVRFNQNRLSTPLPANKKRIRQLLEQEAFDILHIQMPYSPLLAARVVAAAPPRTGIVGTFHILPATLHEASATRLLGISLKRNLRRFDKIFSVSQPAAMFANHALGIDSSVLPNVIELKKFSSARPLQEYVDGKINIVFLGRLVERKGCRYLLQAIAALPKQTRQKDKLRVIIGGAGPLQDELMAYCESNRISDIVEFKGFIDEARKASLLANAHIAVFPSTGGESFGIVLLEAMAAGSEVVIAGDNPGYRSVLGERPEQFISPIDKLGFAATLKRFIEDDEARKISQSWQRDYVRRFDVETVGPRLLEQYEFIAKRHGNRDN